MPDRSIRETYDLPQKTPMPVRQWGLMLLVPAVVVLLWIVLPSSPIVVALLAIVTLAIVFIGVRMVLASRQLHEKPGRTPVPPPSTQ